MTKGYIESDLKVRVILMTIIKLDFYYLGMRLGINYRKHILCVTTYRPMRELIQQERENDLINSFILSSYLFSPFFSIYVFCT